MFLVSSGSHFEFVSLLFFQIKLKSLNSSKSIAIWETLYLGQRSQLLGVWYAYSFCFLASSKACIGSVFIYIFLYFYQIYCFISISSIFSRRFESVFLVAAHYLLKMTSTNPQKKSEVRGDQQPRPSKNSPKILWLVSMPCLMCSSRIPFQKQTEDWHTPILGFCLHSFFWKHC